MFGRIGLVNNIYCVPYWVKCSNVWSSSMSTSRCIYIHDSCKMSPRAHCPFLLINSLFALPSTGTKTFHWQASGSLLTKVKCPNFRWRDNVELHISNSRCLLRTMWIYVQRVPKKMSFLGKIAITTLKLIQNANVGGVLENSGYLLPHRHWDF